MHKAPGCCQHGMFIYKWMWWFLDRHKGKQIKTHWVMISESFHSPDPQNLKIAPYAWNTGLLSTWTIYLQMNVINLRYRWRKTNGNSLSYDFRIISSSWSIKFENCAICMKPQAVVNMDNLSTNECGEFEIQMEENEWKSTELWLIIQISTRKK